MASLRLGIVENKEVQKPSRIALLLPGKIHLCAWLIFLHVADKVFDRLLDFVHSGRFHLIPASLIDSHYTSPLFSKWRKPSPLKPSNRLPYSCSIRILFAQKGRGSPPLRKSVRMPRCACHPLATLTIVPRSPRRRCVMTRRTSLPCGVSSKVTSDASGSVPHV